MAAGALCNGVLTLIIVSCGAEGGNEPGREVRRDKFGGSMVHIFNRDRSRTPSVTGLTTSSSIQFWGRFYTGPPSLRPTPLR